MRERLINFLNRREYDVETLYRFYKEKGGVADVNIFVGILRRSDFLFVYRLFMLEYGINVLKDVNGNIVKFV